MKLLLVLMLSFPWPGLASEIDQRLQLYVKNFGLRALKAPKAADPKLVRLGQFLFTSNLLSGNKNIACVDCHFPVDMTHDGLPLSLGEGGSGRGRLRVQNSGKLIARNSPALFNLDGINILFWDGRITYHPSSRVFITPVNELNGPNPLRSDITSVMTSALAAQSIFPIADAAEMRGRPGSNEVADAADELEAWELIVKRLLASPDKKALLEAAYPGQSINIGHIGEALAAFQRETFARHDTPFDRYLLGDRSALSPLQKEGMEVFFNRGRCGSCHHGPQLSNFRFENIGIPQIGPGKKAGVDLGRHLIDPKVRRYTFRVPPLRNVAVSAPYMHNGAFMTLERVIQHYDDVAASLASYDFISRWTNYSTVIAPHDHSQDSVILSSLSNNVKRKMHFTQAEEEALLEFLKRGLTDVRLLEKTPSIP